MEINKALQMGRETLLKNGIDPREARLLLSFTMKIRSEELIKYKECSAEQYNRYRENIFKRANGEPYAYITGRKEFMKLDFKVNKNVLIPREDTEILVQEIIDICSINLKNKTISILDMCTGSGCIAISLAKYIENAKITAVDISEKALEVAKENAKINEVDINFIKSDLFDNLVGKFDVIVSNPPYISKKDINTLQKEVKSEPILALDGGESGVEFYQRIAEGGSKYMNPNGILAFEIGFNQAAIVKKIMQNNEFQEITVKKDISGNDRIIIGKLQ